MIVTVKAPFGIDNYWQVQLINKTQITFPGEHASINHIGAIFVDPHDGIETPDLIIFTFEDFKSHSAKCWFIRYYVASAQGYRDRFGAMQQAGKEAMQPTQHCLNITKGDLSGCKHLHLFKYLRFSGF